MAELSKDGREYFHWPIQNASVGITTWDAWIGGAWHPMTRTGDVLTLLVEGPSAPTHDQNAVVLTASATGIRIRATDNPEVVPRPGGMIRLVD